MAEGDELYGPDWPARSRRARTRRNGRRKRCTRCWFRRCEEAHHVVRFHRRYARALDGWLLWPLCDDCHDAVHTEDRRHPVAPLWVDTIRSVGKRIAVNVAVIAAVAGAAAWFAWTHLGVADALR